MVSTANLALMNEVLGERLDLNSKMPINYRWLLSHAKSQFCVQNRPP